MMEEQEWRWLNEPAEWHQTDDGLQVVTDQQTDFWRSTWYGFERHSGHLYGCEVAGEFTFQVCVEGGVHHPLRSGGADAAARRRALAQGWHRVQRRSADDRQRADQSAL
nr:DUF1349 domain-containing protein [Aeromonas veronii]